MFDAPTVDELLTAVSRWLRDELPAKLEPADAFQARVAANALELVRRELKQGEGARAEARLRLTALLQQLPGAPLARDADLPALQAELAARIRSRELTPSTPGLLQALQAHTLAKMAVEQPSHALARRLLAPLPATTPPQGTDGLQPPP